MKQLLFLLTFIFGVSLFAQSDTTYPKAVIINGDTVIAFTIEQSRQVAITNEDNKSCQQLYSLCEEQNKVMDSTQQVYDKRIAIKDKQIALKDSTIAITNKKESLHQERVDDLNGEVKLQKNLRKGTTVVGVLGIVLVLIL